MEGTGARGLVETRLAECGRIEFSPDCCSDAVAARSFGVVNGHQIEPT